MILPAIALTGTKVGGGGVRSEYPLTMMTSFMNGPLFMNVNLIHSIIWTHQVILVAKHMRPRQVKHANRVIKRTPGENDLISLITNMQG